MKQRNFQVFAAITVMLLLSGCPAILNSTNDDDSTTTTTTLSELETRTLYNEDAASGYGGKLAVVSGGRQYIVQNNIIDSVAAQKVEYETSTGNFVIKEHTGSSASLAVSFPSIFIGNNNGHATTDSNLPKRNGAIGSLQTGWTWSKSGVSASADFLPLINLWFTASETGNILGPEKWLEIWMAKPTSHNPSGVQIASNVNIGGSLWNVWKDGSNITYVASSELLSVNFDLKPFINDAIPRLTISDSDYLHDVIAGFRIWSAGTGLSSSGFSAIVN
ncbi:MAG: hypothetical protein AAGU26_13070 [bacterium]